MSVGILIVTHGDIGSVMIESAEKVLGVCPLNVEIMSISYKADVEDMKHDAENAITRLNTGEGVLALTDIYGGTPSNIAQAFCDCVNVQLVAGLNLPMLIRVLNYPDTNLSNMTEKALSGGKDGIYLCKKES